MAAVCTADYPRWTVYPRRTRPVRPKYEPSDCRFDANSSYRLTYVDHPSTGPPAIVRPPVSSLPLLTSDEPFDGQTNYQHEFTGGQQNEPKEPATDVLPDVPETKDNVLGLVSVAFMQRCNLRHYGLDAFRGQTKIKFWS